MKITMSVALFAFALASVLHTQAYGQSTPINQQLLETFVTGLTTGNTLSLLQNFRCNITRTPKQERRGAGRWTYVFLNCRDLVENSIPSVLCNRNCIDPTNCQVMRELKGVPVFISKRLYDRSNRMHEIELPVACKCVPITATPSTVESC